ncbi:sigma-54 dependent transcriptional regulator [Chitinophaga sp. CF118]|uniref:sigma-54-dependent transcriptional regulator n=1 Tax=Chitinophaga sp. CF118 TaxID=1884367 RepID=UPI000A78804B|nr:sigma-54 dependent transcriptional regulator [Chitinophaga sp. CF118]
MKEKILIVEDEFIVANDLRIMLTKAGYIVCGTASSVEQARKIIELKNPDWVLLDIILKGDLTGIDLAWELHEKKLPFLYISANTDQSTLEAVKETQPYGFMVKPFRERDLLVMLDIARYRYAVETAQITKEPVTPTTIGNAEEIIGRSEILLHVLEKIRVVAPSSTSVLIMGESGTGKEKIAHSIHNNSAYSSMPMITVNCAALPSALIESELFGHEKGAFTGANSRRIGKFELANNSTLFLDEIGELPLDAQVKLLRVLQEKEIERLGGNETLKIDVRVIAATNRNLEKEVAEGRFRLDLYYRLNIFPVEIPPLRKRKEDIEELAYYFLKKYTQRTGKNLTDISPRALEQLKQYSWPGNIRELEHLVERSVLMATGNVINMVEIPVITTADQGSDNRIRTMEEVEREHILHALKACNGKVFGPGGAAEVLNLPPTTLYSKMKKLGIKQGYV